jgi:hypothetical protein
MKRLPTKEQWDALQGAFRYFNEQLFGGQLSQPILSHSRHRGAEGFLKPKAYYDSEFAGVGPDEVAEWVKAGRPTVWKDRKIVVNELSLNPDHLLGKVEWVMSVLVHEMAHHWQWEHGKPSRPGYHNAEWVRKMEELGLKPWEQDRQGNRTGKQTGQSVRHDIVPGGAFDLAMQRMPEALRLPWTSFVPQKDKEPKASTPKYVSKTCPSCEYKIKVPVDYADEEQTCGCGEVFLTKAELKEWKEDARG